MGRFRTLIPALLLAILSLGQAKYIRWLSLLHSSSSIVHIDREEICDSLEGLSKRQIKMCKRNLEVMDSVRQGARRAIQECQWQFRNRRWNCTTTSTSGGGGGANTLFGKVLRDGTREAAFVHAISAAGVSHAVTTSCSSGQLIRCGCDHTVRGFDPRGFQWSGCSDNVAFGTAFSKGFVDARDIRRSRGRSSPRALMNLHNNEAGRKVLELNMRVECKCHGVSGSCEMKTCWKAMPNFRQVGTLLKEKFDGATEVQALSESVKRRRLVPLNPHFKPHTSNDLIYLDSSSDFCERDDKSGSLGTQGRPCNRSSKATEGCELLCCGRGYNTRTQTVTERCQCKFHWCCFVKCSECQRQVEINTCF